MALARQEDRFVKWRIVAAAVAAFATFVRISEVHGLGREDIQIHGDAIRFRVRSARRGPRGCTAFVPFTRGAACYGQFIVDCLTKCNLQQ